MNLEWEVITDPCPAVNPETGGLCSQRLRDHGPVHWHCTWEHDPETGENEIAGCTKWEAA